jgi:hypothetical protein
MFPQITIRHNIGNIIEIPNELNPKVYTYFGNNYAIGVTSINVDNAIDFTAGSIIVVLGSVGAENCEFGYPSAHTDTTFTLAAATKQPHSRGELVTQVNYDQVEISKSATIDGSYSVIATLPLFLTQQKTVQFDASGLTSDYYKLRWKNSITNTFSEYSEPVSVLSYPEDSVGSVIIPILKAMGISENDPKITIPFCISAINDARKYVNRGKLYGVRQDWLAKFEFPIQVLAGSNFVYLPEDVDFHTTDRSMLSGRFIMNNVLAPFNLKYIDKRSWNQVAFNVGGSVTTAVAAVAATEIFLQSAGDFIPANNEGVAYIATTEFDQEILQIEYTGIDLVAKKLTGVTGIDREIPVGTQVWVTPTIAQPIWYTVYPDGDETDSRGKIVFDRIIPDSMQGNNFYIDYYKRFDQVVDLYQRLPEPYRDIYGWYLRYAIKYRKDITISQSDPDYKKFEELVQEVFNNLYTGQDTIIITS